MQAGNGKEIKTAEEWELKAARIREQIKWMVGDLPAYEKTGKSVISNERTIGDRLIQADMKLDDKLIARLTYPGTKKHLREKTYPGGNPRSGEKSGKLPVVIYLHAYLDAGGHNWARGFGYSPSVGERLAGNGFLAVASVSGFASLRKDVHGDRTEGIRRYSHLRPTIPRLGLFLDEEKRVPYDFHEVLALIAPRRVFILAPRLDQDWVYEDVEVCYREALKVFSLYDKTGNIVLRSPNDFNRYPPEYQQMVIDWLRK